MSETQKHTKPNVPNLRFPGFSGEWKDCSLGSCCSGFDYGMNAASKPFDGDHKYIRITDIDENTSEYKEDGVVSPDAEIDEHYRVKENDILFARTGASTGKTYLYNPKDGKLYYAGFLIRMNVLPLNDSHFIFYQTQTPRYKKWVQIMSMRSGQPGINSQEYSSFRCFLPKLKEQQKIANLLTLIDQRIAIQNKVIEKYESLIKALIDKLVVSLLSGPKVLFEHLYARAGEGGTPSTSVEEYYLKGHIPFIKIDDLSSMYLTDNKDFITKLGVQKSSAWLIPEGSVIYSNGATIGAISINTYPITTKQGILGIIPKKNVLKEYLYFLMRSTFFSKEVQRIVTEGTMKTAYLKDINRIECPLPTITTQHKMVSGLLLLAEKIDIEKRTLQRYQLKKQAFLNQMFI